MIDELQAALSIYKKEWETLVAQRNNEPFFRALKPTSVGWKTKDLAGYRQRVESLRDHADHIFEVWMNGRWIAKIHLKDTTLTWGLSVIKILQRRPDSQDAVGLDHVDFYTDAAIEPTLAAEPGLTWNYEKNNAEWYSIHFEAGEAKVRSDTVCKVCADELMALHNKILV